jgi:CRP-like cAMP-binding protein
MTASPTPKGVRNNRLLNALPASEFARIKPDLRPISLRSGEVLYESGGHIEFVYFPTSAIISRICTTENGATAETGIIGNDGLAGIALFLGGETTPNREIVQSAGSAFRMSARAAQKEFGRGGAFQQILLRYTQALMTQISQTAICNRLHSVEQHLCRWLLINHDLLEEDKMVMTHETIAHMLGARRGSISEAAGRLQAKGLISYVRGIIIMRDRKGLETSVCECFQVVKDEYCRLLGQQIVQ